MMIEKPKRIFIEDMKEQEDGRMKLILGNGTVIEDLAVCCHAQEVEMEDSFFYEIYFEKVKK